MRHPSQPLVLLFLLACCCGARGTEVSSLDTSLDARVRTALEIPNEEPLTESRFREAVFKRFPVGSSWTEVEAKIRTLLASYGLKPDPRKARVDLHDRERHILCQLARDVGFIGCSFFDDPTMAAVSLNNRSWHFQIRFDGTKAVQQVWAGLTSSPCWQDPNRSEACLKNAIDDCLSRGGIWYGHASGRGRNTGCNLPTTDGGKPCTNRTQCQGACIPASSASPNGAGCVCDRWTMLPKGEATLCTEKGVQAIHFE